MHETYPDHYLNLLNHRMVAWWTGALGKASDLRFTGHGFESCRGTVVQATYTCVPLSTSSITWTSERAEMLSGWESKVKPGIYIALLT